MTAPVIPIPVVLDETRLSAADVARVLSGAGVGRPDLALFDVTGPGAVACVQGLVTSDIDTPGEGSFTYGAILTPKGMMRTDVWAMRRGGAVRLCAPAAGRAALLEVLGRSLPPRLARYAEVTGEVRVTRLVGPRALDIAGAAGLPLPEPGRVVTMEGEDEAWTIARPTLERAPFALELHGQHDATNLDRRLGQAGAVQLSEEALDLSRLLAGWPRLGAEIDEKTLPQEVRFDDIGGVSYTKGCYTGQETVARLHFRGHANRGLTGLVWKEAPDPAESLVRQDEHPLGQVTSAAWIEPTREWVGLAKLRRELDRTRAVTAAGAPADVVGLPFEPRA
ncbi:MAG: folate-binding protein YgfZ [Gemmatimonadetes bacterium]|nr:folate-binding protein YgfZ [Gemmatimonadota bacterium]